MSELDVAVDAVRMRFGEQALLRGSRLAAVEAWPSGVAAVDSLSGIGGLPRGRLTVLTGRGTCGKLSLAFEILAAATRDLAHAVAIDPARCFDAWTLAAHGAELDRLTVVRPPDAASCGEAALALARSGCGFLLLLLPAGLLGAADAWLPALESAAGRSGAVLVGVAEEVTPALAHAASFTLGLERTGWLEEAGEPVGLRAATGCLKNRVAAPGRTTELEIRYPLTGDFAGGVHVRAAGDVDSAGKVAVGGEECLVRSAAG